MRPSEQDRKYCSRECYGKAVGLRQQGANHPMYKHGMTAQKLSERQRLRKHKDYTAWRDKVYARDEYKCRACRTGTNLQAHHHAAWVDEPKLRLKVSNGITLCDECHRLWHAYERKGLFVGKESLLQKKVQSALTEYGFFVYNVPGTPFGTSGIPDLVACYRGVFGGLECKVFPNYLSEQQKAAGDRIRQSGGIFVVIQSEDDIGKVIELFETKALERGWCDEELVVDNVSALEALEP